MGKNVREPIDEEKEYQRVSGNDGDKAKSEAVREMFDFPRHKLPQRTRLNLKEIQTFALIKTNMEILNPEETRMWPLIYIENIMEFKISLDGKGRFEGMSIFQTQAEEKEIEEAYMPK